MTFRVGLSCIECKRICLFVFFPLQLDVVDCQVGRFAIQRPIARYFTIDKTLRLSWFDDWNLHKVDDGIGRRERSDQFSEKSTKFGSKPRPCRIVAFLFANTILLNSFFSFSIFISVGVAIGWNPFGYSLVFSFFLSRLYASTQLVRETASSARI